jgi:hypothetical protein
MTQDNSSTEHVFFSKLKFLAQLSIVLFALHFVKLFSESAESIFCSSSPNLTAHPGEALLCRATAAGLPHERNACPPGMHQRHQEDSETLGSSCIVISTDWLAWQTGFGVRAASAAAASPHPPGVALPSAARSAPCCQGRCQECCCHCCALQAALGIAGVGYAYCYASQ